MGRFGWVQILHERIKMNVIRKEEG